MSAAVKRPSCDCLPFAGVCLKGAPDELLLGQLRDWNEELQLARELPADTDQQRVFRDRTLFKVLLHERKRLSH